MDFGLLPLDDSHSEKLSFLPSTLRGLIEYQRGLSDFDPTRPDDYMLYTGRGPSHGSFHIGHLPGIQLIKAFQEYLKTKLFFMISDDEKIFRDDIDKTKMAENVANTMDQLAKLGLTDKNTHYHINSAGISAEHYGILIRLLGMTNINTLNNIFGEKTNVGEYFYPLYQILPCFLGKQCIVVAGKDQDPFFRLARDLARRIGHKPPILLYTKSVPGLDGTEKMSTSVPTSLPIFLTDTPALVKMKIAKVKKVGAGSLDELFEYGANLEQDTLYHLLQFFEQDASRLAMITRGYTVGYSYDADEVQQLRDVCGGEKSVIVRDQKAMLTTGGLRTYVTHCISQYLF
jgi:tryptophanyl-tRNA synthetase